MVGGYLSSGGLARLPGETDIQYGLLFMDDTAFTFRLLVGVRDLIDGIKLNYSSYGARAVEIHIVPDLCEDHSASHDTHRPSDPRTVARKSACCSARPSSWREQVRDIAIFTRSCRPDDIGISCKWQL